MKHNQITLLLFFIIILFVFVSGCSPEKKTKTNDWAKRNLNGKVKATRELTYQAIDKFGKIQKGDVITETYKLYNEKGMTIESNNFSARTSIVYNVEGDKYLYKYNDEGKETEQAEYSADGILKRKWINSYNDKGDVVEEDDYSSDGSLVGKNIIKYDDKGNEIEKTNCLPDGKVEQKWINKYDSEGNKVEVIWTTANHVIDNKTINKYDDKGNNVETMQYSLNDSLKSIQIYKYDDRENKIENICRVKLEGTKFMPVSWSEQKRSYKYEYDNKGNWISKIEYDGYKPVHVIEREITYFDAAAKNEEDVKKACALTLSRMNKEYAELNVYEKRDISSKLKKVAWGRFYITYSEDNPYSSEDNAMREKVLAQIAYWGSGVISYAERAKRIAGIPTTKNSIGMVFVLVQPGSFQTGHDDIFDDATPACTVTISKPFYIGKHEVTQKQWRDVMGSNPSYYEGGNRPVRMVSWEEAQEFIQKLNEKERSNKYRLPTEAEWEYAARGGIYNGGFIYAGSDNIEDVAVYSGNSGSETKPVGTKEPNELGIFDMSGNVWEWCEDLIEPNIKILNSIGLSTRYPVKRGGSFWRSTFSDITSEVNKYNCRVCSRNVGYVEKEGDEGFRIVRE